jgi:hypothetical protein
MDESWGILLKLITINELINDFFINDTFDFYEVDYIELYELYLSTLIKFCWWKLIS